LHDGDLDENKTMTMTMTIHELNELAFDFDVLMELFGGT
jgi:hypothetical protein